MLTEDYILRMISMATAFLAQILHLKRAGQFQQAHQAIHQALEQLFGLRADLAKNLDDDHLLELLTSQGKLVLDRLAVVAELYRQEGEVLASLDRPAESSQAYQRALRFFLEVALADPVSLPLNGDDIITDLAQKLRSETLPEKTSLALLDYYDRRGERSEKG